MSSRYLVFGSDLYYPSGGMDDLLMKVEELNVAKAFVDGFLLGETLRWAHIYDNELEQIVYRG